MACEEPDAVEGTIPRVQLTRADVCQLIERDYQGLRRLILRQTGDIHVASDILNEAVCITWEKWRDGKLARPEEIGGYIFQVAVNLLRNRRRIVVERSDRRADPQILETIAAEQPQDQAFETRLAATVRDIIASMDSTRDRLVLVRFYLNEEDKDAICKDLGLSASQFAKILHRARSRLRELFEAQGLKGTDLLSAWLL